MPRTTPPPDSSSDRPPSASLPPPPRRKKPDTVQSPAEENFDGRSIPIERQGGFSWLANYPDDPLKFVLSK